MASKKPEITIFTEWVPRTEKEVGCGYCKYEKTCGFYKEQKVNKARENWARKGCPDYKRYDE